jgi:hypothetical protein
MKKVLVTIAALGLVLGVTATAFALDQPGAAATVPQEQAIQKATPTAPGVSLWSVKGEWGLAGAYLSDGLGMPGGASLTGSGPGADAFYIYSFKLLPTLQVNDKIAMKAEFRFADRDVFGLTDTVLDGGRQIDTYTLWMEWNSPLGKTQFGRIPAGTWAGPFFNSTRQGDRIKLYLNMLPANWGSLVFLEKLTEQDAGTSGSDDDRDAYYVDLSYKADFGKTIAAMWIVRNAQSTATDPYTTTNFWAYGDYTFGAISLEWELDYGFGDANATQDKNSLGLYGDLGYKMDDWNFGLMAFYASGDNDPNDNDVESAMSNATGIGKDFNPFNIMGGDYMNILNGDNPLAGDSINSAIKIGSGNAGVIAVKAYAGFAVSPALSLNGYLGYAQADSEPTGWDSDYGMEAGVGFGYKIMDNLSYGAHFSYLWTGDYFNEGKTESTQDVYLVAHQLSMSF